MAVGWNISGPDFCGPYLRLSAGFSTARMFSTLVDTYRRPAAAIQRRVGITNTFNCIKYSTFGGDQLGTRTDNTFSRGGKTTCDGIMNMFDDTLHGVDATARDGLAQTDHRTRDIRKTDI